ncbi:MAG: hypothetical protein IKH15_08170 [Bacteroidales bacterium]|nr:hypothetical protein [Bacteroidales bacterium]MBR4637061.1 hypothetical protein [Bacteroidales bacterium]
MDKKQVISDALWVDVGDYFVTRDGRIFKTRNRRNAKKRNVREVKQSDNGDGYLRFSHDGKKVRSHRFIAEAFISNPDNLPQINHRDEHHSTPNSNSPLNLEWCDAAYNNNYGTRNERAAKAKSKKIYQYSLDGTFIREWPSLREVQRLLGWSFQNISKCCLGERKTAYGFKWSYDPPC